MSAGGDKTEKATPQRLREARKRGDTPMSSEFTGAALALVALVAFQQQGAHIVTGLLALLSRDLLAAGNVRDITEATIEARMRTDVLTGLSLLVPLVATVVVAALAIGALNTRGLLSLKSAMPSLRKLNPLNNAKNLVGKEALIMLLKAALKVVVAVVIVLMWTPAWEAMVPAITGATPAAGVGMIASDTMSMVLQITAAYVVLGAVDLGYRYFAYYRRMRMTKQEVKEEMQRSEGNPQTRARIRQSGRKRLRALMERGGVRRVPQADVVVTNPTHFAVAIQYTAGKMRAPKVIAKGQNLVAQRIKEAARGHDIPIVENKPLAQALYKSVDVNREIPPDLYQAVAQVLAFVYRMKRPRRQSGRSQ